MASPEWREIGYMTLDNAKKCYWCYRFLCWLETKIKRKVF